MFCRWGTREPGLVPGKQSRLKSLGEGATQVCVRSLQSDSRQGVRDLIPARPPDKTYPIYLRRGMTNGISGLSARGAVVVGVPGVLAADKTGHGLNR